MSEEKDYKIMEYYSVGNLFFVAVCKNLDYIGLLTNGYLKDGESMNGSLLYKLCVQIGEGISQQQFDSMIETPLTVSGAESLQTYLKVVENSSE